MDPIGPASPVGIPVNGKVQVDVQLPTLHTVRIEVPPAPQVQAAAEGLITGLLGGCGLLALGLVVAALIHRRA